MAPATPLPLRLRTRPSAMLLLLGASAAFVAGGVFILPTSPARGWAAIVFFGLGVVVAVVNLLPGGSYLELEQRGFTLCTLFRKSFFRWQDTVEFYPFSSDGAKAIVALRFAPTYQDQAAARRFATRLAGAEGALPGTYGMSADDLAALLNKVRAEQIRSF